MSIEPLNKSNEKLSDTLSKDNENLICKDGFCSLPNIDNSKQLNNNSNIFDPLQSFKLYMFNEIVDPYKNFWIQAGNFKGLTNRSDKQWVQLINFIIKVITLPLFLQNFWIKYPWTRRFSRFSISNWY